jgi:hypothetical protein
VTIVECTRERDVLDALTSDHWPDDLRAHTSTCAICSDLVAAVQPILVDRVDLSSEGHLPTSGVMWWRAQMRARQEAVREAARPITIAQAVGAVFVLALIVSAIAWVSPVVRAWFVDSTANIVANVRNTEFSATTLASQHWLLLAMGLVWLLLAPLVIYFVVAED